LIVISLIAAVLAEIPKCLPLLSAISWTVGHSQSVTDHQTKWQISIPRSKADRCDGVNRIGRLRQVQRANLLFAQDYLEIMSRSLRASASTPHF